MVYSPNCVGGSQKLIILSIFDTLLLSIISKTKNRLNFLNYLELNLLVIMDAHISQLNRKKTKQKKKISKLQLPKMAIFD